MTVAGDDLSITYRRDGTAVVLEVHGDVDVATSAQLRQGLLGLIEDQGNLSVVLDLRDLAFIDSTGLTVLMQAHERMAGKHGRLVLSGAPARTLRLFRLAGLDAVLDITT